MIIDTDIKVGNRRNAVVHNRTRPTVQKVSGGASSQYEQLVEYRHRVNELSTDLSSAIQALVAANEEIARLNNDLAESQAANKSLQEALDAQMLSVKAKGKRGKRVNSEQNDPNTTQGALGG